MENYGNNVTATPSAADIEVLAKVGGTATIVSVSGVQVTGLTFVKDGVTATYNGTTWVVTKP